MAVPVPAPEAAARPQNPSPTAPSAHGAGRTFPQGLSPHRPRAPASPRSLPKFPPMPPPGSWRGSGCASPAVSWTRHPPGHSPHPSDKETPNCAVEERRVRERGGAHREALQIGGGHGRGWLRSGGRSAAVAARREWLRLNGSNMATSWKLPPPAAGAARPPDRGSRGDGHGRAGAERGGCRPSLRWRGGPAALSAALSAAEGSGTGGQRSGCPGGPPRP